MFKPANNQALLGASTLKDSMLSLNSAKPRHLLLVATTTVMFSLIALCAEANAWTQLTRFPGNSADHQSINGGPAIAGDNNFIARRISRTLTILQRIDGDGSRSTVGVVKRSRSLATFPDVEFRTSERSVIAVVREIESTDDYFATEQVRQVWIGSNSRAMRPLRGRPTGVITADRENVAAVFAQNDGSIDIKIFSTTGRNTKLLRTLDVQEVTGVASPVGSRGGLVTAIDIDRDLIAIALPTSTFLVNWQSETVVRSIPHGAPGEVEYLSLIAPTLVAIVSKIGGKTYTSSAAIGSDISTGARLWSRPYFFPISTSDNKLVLRAGEAVRNQVNPLTGTESPFATGLSYLDSEANSPTLLDLDVSESRYVWTEKDCYWSLFMVKQPTEVVTRAASSCPVSFVKRSMRLRGRMLSIGFSAAEGFRDAKALLRVGRASESRSALAMRPGRHRVSFRVSRRFAARIRRGGSLKVALRRYGAPDVNFRGRVRLAG